MEGYDFESAGDDVYDYKCPICLLLLRQALLMPCSHSACKDCLLKWEHQAETGDFRCPSCNRKYEREQVHAGEEGKFIDRVVTTSLKVKCKQHLRNCNWVGTISNYEIHEKTCTQKSTACNFPGCDVIATKKDLSHHQKICDYRIVECEYCTEMIQFIQLQHHYGICDYYDVICQQDCGLTLKRKYISTHISQECPNTEVSCSYQKMGCTQKIMRKDLADHMNISTQQHSNLLLQHILKLTNEVSDLKQTNGVLNISTQQHSHRLLLHILQLTNEVSDLEQTNEVLRIEMHLIRESSSINISQLKQKLEEKEKELHNINEKMVVIENQMNHRNEKASGDLKTISDKMEILETKLEVQEKRSNEEILLIKNVVEEFKGFVLATSMLSEEDRSKDWSFDELKKFIRNQDNDRFVGIITLRPKLALLNRNFFPKETLLHIASECNNIPCIDVLLKNGCVVNYEDVRGRKPIHDAAFYGSFDAAKKLLLIDENLINTTNSRTKETPLHYAASQFNEDFVKYLLTQPGIDVNLKDSDDRMADEYIHGSKNRSKSIRIQSMIREFRGDHL